MDARTATSHFPGVGRYSAELAQAMSRLLQADEELVLIGPASSQTRLDLTGDRVSYIGSSLSPFSLRQQLAIPNLLRRNDICVYHSTYYLMPYRPAIPTVLTVYDLIPVLFPASVSLKARFLFGLAHRLALKASSAVITISATTAQALVSHHRIAPEKVQTIHLGVSERFTPASADGIARLKTKYELPHEFALYVGINKPHKNLPALLRAWQIEAKRKPGSVLVIAGPQDRRYLDPGGLAQMLGLQENVRLIGRVPDADLPALYSAANLFVFPSLYEGFGLPVLESMACGTPVICSDIPALREVAGDAAAYFDAGSVHSIARTICRVVEDPCLRSELKAAGLARSANFTWEAAASASLDVYRHLVQ